MCSVRDGQTAVVLMGFHCGPMNRCRLRHGGFLFLRQTGFNEGSLYSRKRQYTDVSNIVNNGDRHVPGTVETLHTHAPTPPLQDTGKEMQPCPYLTHTRGGGNSESLHTLASRSWDVSLSVPLIPTFRGTLGKTCGWDELIKELALYFERGTKLMVTEQPDLAGHFICVVALSPHLRQVTS